MILKFKSFTLRIDTNIYKYNSNTIDYEILTLIYNIWHKKRDSKNESLIKIDVIYSYSNECCVITAGFSIPINSKIVGAMSPKTPL